MGAQYEMTSGYVGSIGEHWEPVDEATANAAIDSAMSFLGYPETHREQFLAMLNTFKNGKRLAAKTGKKSPNYYYDHGMEKIRAIRTEEKPELVKCTCGHSVPRGSVMSASMGSSCPECYDRMSD